MGSNGKLETNMSVSFFTKVQGESLFVKQGNYEPEVSMWFRRHWLEKNKYCFKVVFSSGVLKYVPAGIGR